MTDGTFDDEELTSEMLSQYLELVMDAFAKKSQD